MKNMCKRIWRHFILVATLFLLFSTSIFAQGQLASWSELYLVYFSDLVDYPTLVPDASGMLHLFWWGLTENQPSRTSEVIMYARWDGENWTVPTDIIIGPNGVAAKLPAGVVDTEGILHVIWAGPQLYYSFAPSWRAENPRAWSEPCEIGNGKVVVSPSDIAVGPNGELHVVFSAQGDEVYHIVSEDGGTSWDSPVPISTASPGMITNFAQMVVNDAGVLYVVWDEVPYPEGYPPQGVFFASSSDGGGTWTAATRLSPSDYGEPAIAMDANGRLHVAYNGRAGVGGKYHRWSSDGGASWSEMITVREAGTGGLNGHPQLAVDGVGRVYFIGGDGAWFATWEEGAWSTLENLLYLASTPLSGTEQPAISVVGGDQLQVVFWSGLRDRLWHTWKTIDAPKENVTSYISELDAPIFNETVVPDVTPEAMSVPAADLDLTEGTAVPTMSLTPVILPTAFCVGLVLFTLLIRHRRRP